MSCTFQNCRPSSNTLKQERNIGEKLPLKCILFHILQRLLLRTQIWDKQLLKNNTSEEGFSQNEIYEALWKICFLFYFECRSRRFEKITFCKWARIWWLLIRKLIASNLQRSQRREPYQSKHLRRPESQKKI